MAMQMIPHLTIDKLEDKLSMKVCVFISLKRML
jgi:hypothetical protein